MSDTNTNINQIKQAEQEAQEMIESAKKETTCDLVASQEQLKNATSLAQEKLKITREKLERETDQAIKEYEKIADQKQKIALERLAEIDDTKIEKTVRLVVESMI